MRDDEWEPEPLDYGKTMWVGRAITAVFAGVYLVALMVFHAPPLATALILGGPTMVALMGTSIYHGMRSKPTRPTRMDWVTAIGSVLLELALLWGGVAIWFLTGSYGLAIVPFFGAAFLGVVWMIFWSVHKLRRDAREAEASWRARPAQPREADPDKPR